MENKCDKVTTRGGHCISVIVPVYKVEPYLRCCIDSILAQTFMDFELILIDDGSPDNCGAICDEYAAKDPRVVMIHQENAGVSAARNAGLVWVFANSNSEWITFVDSDDYIPPEYLEHLVNTALQENVELVSTLGAYFEADAKIENINCFVHSIKRLSGRRACESLYRGEGLIDIAPWGKLIRKELLKDLRFPEGKMHEDQDLIPKLLYNTEKVVALRAWAYGYRQNPEGAIRSRFSLRRFDDIDAIDSCVSFFTEKRDQELVELAKRKRMLLLADYVIKAWRVGIYSKLPDKYGMPLWKALLIILGDTFQRGGLKYIFVRLGKFICKLMKK